MIYILILVVIGVVVLGAFALSGGEGHSYSGNRSRKNNGRDQFNGFTF